MSTRRERILRATLPIGLGLLVLWIAWMAVGLVVQPEGFAIGWVSAVLGLITSLVLIITGYGYRRDLDRR